jgi:hypothetical protein
MCCSVIDVSHKWNFLVVCKFLGRERRTSPTVIITGDRDTMVSGQINARALAATLVAWRPE